MSDFDPDAVLRVPGQLYVGVTNLATANYGGQKVGHFENGRAVIAEESEDILSEANGNRVGKLVCETLIGVEFDLVQYDTTTLAFPWVVSGTTILSPGLGRSRAPGYQTPGVPLLFAPRDPEHPGFIIYAPVYRLGVKMIPFGDMEEKRRERITVDAIVASNGKDWACDLVRNLTLT